MLKKLIFVLFCGLIYSVNASDKNLPEVNYWRAFEVFKTKDDPKGLEYAKWWLEHWNKVFSKSTIEKDAQTFQNTVRTKALEMDLEDLYNILPFQKNSTSHYVLIQGVKNNDDFLIKLSEKNEDKVTEGEFYFLAQIDEVSKREKVYRFSGRGGIGVGAPSPISWEAFWRKIFAFGFQERIENDWPVGMKESLPNFSKLIEDLFVLKVKLESVSPFVVDVNIDAKIDLLKWKNKYPKIYRYLRLLDDLVSYGFSISDSSNSREFIKGHYNGRNRSFKLNFKIHSSGSFFWEGRPIAYDSMQMYPSKGDISLDIGLRFQGVYPNVIGWKIPYSRTFEKDQWKIQAGPLAMPLKVEVDGNWFMKFPIWLTKKAFDLTEELNEFLFNLNNRESHQGLVMSIETQKNKTAKRDEHLFSGSIEFPFKVSGIIQLGFEIMAYRLNPPAAVVEEAERLRGLVIDLLKKDLSLNMVEYK